MGTRRTRTWALVSALALAVGVVALGGPAPVAAAPAHFHMPFPCGETWKATTYSGHSSNAIDLNWGVGSDNLGRSVAASAAGTAYRKSNPGGYGNYVDVEHGGGWVTRYAHLSAFSVPNGAAVTAGQVIGKVGSTGSSTAPHLHYEQRLNGARQPITWSGQAIVYRYSPGVQYTSKNCPGGNPEAWIPLVDRQTSGLLGRAPTATERARWTQALAAGTRTPTDMVVELRTSGESQTTVDPMARLYRAYFLRRPDVAGLRYWVGERRTGLTLDRISQSFAASPEFRTLYGELGSQEFVERVYENVLGRPGEADGVAYWTGELEAGLSRGALMTRFSESPEYRAGQRIWVDTVVIVAGLLGRMATNDEILWYTAGASSTRTIAEWAVGVAPPGP